jgi:hypothetical protein
MNSLEPADSSDGKSKWLEEHLKLIEKKIRTEADKIAEREGHGEDVEPGDIATAALLYAPGNQFPAGGDVLNIPFWRRMALSITGVTLVSGLLAIVFGVLGYFEKNGQNPQLASGAFDIAKIFAGAVVGSTGSSLAAGTKRG